MMARTQTRFVCQECGRISPKALGRCPQCGAWDSMIEEIVETQQTASSHANQHGLGGLSIPKKLSEIEGNSDERIPVPIGEFSRVLGGGVVPGSIVLIGGDPGIGKSTLLLQMTMQMAGDETGCCMSPERNRNGRYKMRAMRLLGGIDGSPPTVFTEGSPFPW